MRHLKGFHQLFESQQELTQEQRDWIDQCTEGKWQVNPQTGLVDIEGNFKLSRQGLTDFKGVRFGEVSGDFHCYNNPLVSLEGAPQSVGGDFNCSFNSLTSLKGAPQSVDGDFNCSFNSLTSLEGAPQSVGGNFYCYYNSLTSLEGAPQSVGGNFDCYSNPISAGTIRGIIERMKDKKIPLERAVAEYWKRIPDEDKQYLAKHNPDLSPEERRGYAALERLKTRII